MKKWIRVNQYYHGDGSIRSVYIETKKILAFWRVEGETTTIYFDYNSDLTKIKETPEEIMELMKGNKKK